MSGRPQEAGGSEPSGHGMVPRPAGVDPKRADPPPAHHCHALRCEEEVAPHLLMCRRHWFMVPKLLRQEVWRLYRPGQERSKQPTAEYVDAARRAIAAVAAHEFGPRLL